MSDVMKVPQFRLSAMSPRATPTDRDRDPIAGHNTAGDCWLVIHGKVYDVSQFMTDHPGGPESLLGACADSRACVRCRAAPAGRRMRRLAPCNVFFSRTLASFPANQCVEFAGRNATSGFEDSSHSSSARKMMAKCVGVELRSFLPFSVIFSSRLLPRHRREPSVCAQRRCVLRAL